MRLEKNDNVYETSFQIGDRVKCVDPGNGHYAMTERDLKLDGIYIIDRIAKSSQGHIRIHPKGVETFSGFYPSRFVLDEWTPFKEKMDKLCE